MVRVARTVRIDAPAERVWDVIAGVEGWPRWASYMKSLVRQGEGPFGVGSRVRVTPKGLPGSMWTVTAFEAGRSYTWETQIVPGLRMAGGHTVEPAGDGATATFSLEASGPLALATAPALALVFQRNTRLATEGLKAYCEVDRP